MSNEIEIDCAPKRPFRICQEQPSMGNLYKISGENRPVIHIGMATCHCCAHSYEISCRDTPWDCPECGHKHYHLALHPKRHFSDYFIVKTLPNYPQVPLTDAIAHDLSVACTGQRENCNFYDPLTVCPHYGETLNMEHVLRLPVRKPLFKFDEYGVVCFSALDAIEPPEHHCGLVVNADFKCKYIIDRLCARDPIDNRDPPRRKLSPKTPQPPEPLVSKQAQRK